MPTIAGQSLSLAAGNGVKQIATVKCDQAGQIRSNGNYTPQKRRLRSDGPPEDCSVSSPSPMKRKSPRRCVSASPNSSSNGIEKDSCAKLTKMRESPRKRLSYAFVAKSRWNPRDSEQMIAVKEALHVSTAPPVVVCREDEQKRVLEFCKTCVEQGKAGSLYVCGCPGTGKSLSLEKVKQLLIDWTNEAGFQAPDVLAINCTSLTSTAEIFSKMPGISQSWKKTNGSTSPLKHLQNLYSQKPQSSGLKMMLMIVDELDYLITKDRAVLHDLFMLTTLPFSRCILIGIANAIDLADRFLPKLRSLNCKPMIVTFRAYSNDQILRILQQRLMTLPYSAFQPRALELCARKVAAASGDMRKALCICRSAIEMLEAELREITGNLNVVEKGHCDLQTSPAIELSTNQEMDIVRIDHVALALSKTYRSSIVDTIQTLPQHQQILLCSAAKLFRCGKKDTTVRELNKFYVDICKSAVIPPVGFLEFSSMCWVLGDQGLLKIGQSREDKSKRVTLNVDEADITFALQGVRFFRNFLQ